MHSAHFQRINNVLLLCIALIMPLVKALIPFLILLWGLNWLFVQPPADKWLHLKKNLKPLLIFTALFFVYLLSMSYTDNTKAGWFDIEVKLMLLLAPMILFTGAFPGIENSKKILLAFIAGCFLSMSVALGHAVYEYFFTYDISVFLYTGFSFLMHPTYFALYLNFSVILLFYLLFTFTHIRILYRIIIASLIVYFGVGIVLAASKAVIFTLITTLFSALVFYLSKKKYFRKALVVLFVILIAAFAVVYKSPTLYGRMVESANTLMRYLNQEKLRDLDGTSQRILAWQCTLRLIGQNAITGVGAGDVKDELVKEYYKNEYYYLTEKKLNPHNQFLQTFLATGIAGIVSLLLLFAIPLYKGIRLRHFVYVNFLIIVFINFLTESMLEKQAGVVFFAFFNSLLFVHIQSGKSELTKTDS